MLLHAATIRPTGGVRALYFWMRPRLFSEKLIRSQCVVVVVKRLNVLTTCREKLISDCTEAGTYSPPSLNVVLMRPHTGARRLTTWRRTVAWILVVEGGGPVPCSGN